MVPQTSVELGRIDCNALRAADRRVPPRNMSV